MKIRADRPESNFGLCFLNWHDDYFISHSSKSEMHYFWLTFALEFGMRSLREWGYMVLTLLVIIALLLRLLDRRNSSREVANLSK